MFKSRAATALPTLEKALSQETVGSVKVALEQARAAILLTTPDTSEADKLKAIAIVRDRGDQDALGLLSDIPARETPVVAKAASDAIAAIQTHLANGMRCRISGTGFRSARFFPAAIGLAITFGVMGVINMAHGEMVMLGA